MRFIKYMYSSIHPGMIQLAVKDAKLALTKEAKKGGKPVNVYLTMGAEGMDDSFYTGAVSALLWLQDYIDIAKSSFDCTQTDVDTVKKVLRKIGLPHVSDVRVEVKPDPKGESKESKGESKASDSKDEPSDNKGTPKDSKGESNDSNSKDSKAADSKPEPTSQLVATTTCRHYASFLGSLVQWASTGVTSTVIQGRMRSNLELSRFLSKLALNSFPSIPFTAFYIGSVKTGDMMDFAERMSRVVDFNKYMTPESITLNQPKFVVQTDNAPLVGITGHPLSNMIYGQENNGHTEWFGLFMDNPEFSNLCIKNGVSVKDVKKYIYMTSWKEHQSKVASGDRLALFIQNQNIIKDVFEMRHKECGIDEDDAYEI